MNSIRYNLARLLVFRGRESRSLFWPYAGFVVVLAIVLMMAVMIPMMVSEMARMQHFAAEHPELATVQAGPGSYSISTHDNRQFQPNLDEI